MSSFDDYTCIFSGASILASVLVGASIGPSIRFAGGMSVFVLVILFFQIIILSFTVGIPILITVFQRRFRLSSPAKIALGIAVLGIVLEILSVWLIPGAYEC